MSTRISTAHAFDQSVGQLQRRQQALAEAGLQLTSGKRVNRASDDPAAAARSERMQALQARNTASQRALDASQNAMSLAEMALGQATDLLHSVRETVMQAGNGSLSGADRESLAAALRELRGQLLSVANASDGAGGHVFGGQGSAAPPFLDTPDGVVFRGTGGQNQVSQAPQFPVTLDGASTWLQARSGNGVFETGAGSSNLGSGVIDTGQVVDPQALTGSSYELTFSVSGGTTTYSVWKGNDPDAVLEDVPYSDGQAVEIDGMSFTVRGAPADDDSFSLRPSTPSLDIFGAMDRVLAVLDDPNQSDAAVAQAVGFGLRDVDAVMNRVQATRAEAGAILNRLDSSADRLEAQSLAARTAQSQAEDLDMVDAISNFQNQQVGYQAALQSYAAIQQLSLFQYM